MIRDYITTFDPESACQMMGVCTISFKLQPLPASLVRWVAGCRGQRGAGHAGSCLLAGACAARSAGYTLLGTLTACPPTGPPSCYCPPGYLLLPTGPPACYCPRALLPATAHQAICYCPAALLPATAHRPSCLLLPTSPPACYCPPGYLLPHVLAVLLPCPPTCLLSSPACYCLLPCALCPGACPPLAAR